MCLPRARTIRNSGNLKFRPKSIFSLAPVVRFPSTLDFQTRNVSDSETFSARLNFSNPSGDFYRVPHAHAARTQHVRLARALARTFACMRVPCAAAPMGAFLAHEVSGEAPKGAFLAHEVFLLSAGGGVSGARGVLLSAGGGVSGAQGVLLSTGGGVSGALPLRAPETLT